MANKTSNKTNAPVVKTHVPTVCMFTVEQDVAFKRAVEISGMKAAGFVRTAVINFAATFNVEIPVVEPKPKGRPSNNAELLAAKNEIAELKAMLERVLAKAGEPDSNVASR
jgi:hypothetical protein